MTHLVRSDDTRRDQIVDLIEFDLLPFQLFPNRVKAFDTSLDDRDRHFRFVQFFLDPRSDGFQKCFVLAAALL